MTKTEIRLCNLERTILSLAVLFSNELTEHDRNHMSQMIFNDFIEKSGIENAEPTLIHVNEAEDK